MLIDFVDVQERAKLHSGYTAALAKLLKQMSSLKECLKDQSEVPYSIMLFFLPTLGRLCISSTKHFFRYYIHIFFHK